MPIYQSWNPKTKRGVKYKKTRYGVKYFDVKQRNPSIPFKGVPSKGWKKHR